ncbi:MAG: hypothetical protein M1818_004362 [Claussenomyces sp. TS43310]|nr:MAG: hypothetical protein M1818_004362 [Claussenomyces sp. TS43310]
MALVKSIWPVRNCKRPTVEISQNFDSTLRRYASTVVQSRQSADTYQPHVMGGVDQLRAEGYTGKGLFVAIIDTGVDYNHPALGGGFGLGYKIRYGYDLVGDAYDGTPDTVPIPDDDPFSSCEGHGTHVSGIVGADSNPYNFTGIIPDATLGMYRVFGCASTSSNDVLISAFMMAFEDGADVITASISGYSGWGEDPWAVAVSRIVAAGTPCSLAAGNDGSSGIFESSAAADGKGVLSVGSIDSETEPANLTVGTFFVANGTNGGEATPPTQFTYNLGRGFFPSATMNLYAIDLDTTNPSDGCTPLPADTPDLSNYFVLIRRGTCTYGTKAGYAQEYAAQYVILYNNAPGTSSPDDNSTPGILGVSMVTAAQGAEWIASLAAGEDVVLTTNTPQTSSYTFVIHSNNITGGYMSSFSSWGPTYEMSLTPIISAPGGYILSTWPLSSGGYAVLSGTSMATPYIAGIVALIKQARGSDTDSATINSILSSTARPVTFNDGSDARYPYLAPIVQQGGGLVDAYSAVHAQSIVRPAAILFNDTRHFLREALFSIENVGNTAITYEMSHIPAGTAYTLDAFDGLFSTPFPPSIVTNTAALTFYPSSISVEPGSFGIIRLQLTLPVGLERRFLPMYGGYIAINGSNGESFTLPYAGVDADLAREATVMDTSDGFPWLTDSADPNATPSDSNTIFVLAPNATAALDGNASSPAIAIGLALGTAYLDVDVVPQPSSSDTYWGLGSIAGFPKTYLTGGANGLFEAFAFAGLLSTGELVPPGSYTLLVRALKIMGDPSCTADYEMYSTVTFQIIYTT